MATFPSNLPLPAAEGYALSPVDPAIRTNMEVGAARVRRHTSARNDRIAVIWLLNDAQMATFRGWFDNASQAAGGAAWFSIRLAIGGSGIQTYEARFVGVWQARLLPSLRWSVSATLEVR